jgi:hypothetical protein
MKIMKITALKWALALAAVLALSGTGWAKGKPTFAGPGTDGQFTDSTRTTVTLSVPVPQQQCKATTQTKDSITLQTTTQTYSYSVKAYILQPSGRILAIGFSDPTDFDCVKDQNVNVTITAVQGLSFKPGLATLVYQVMETTTTTVTDATNKVLSTTITTNVINEYGSTVNLH